MLTCSRCGNDFLRSDEAYNDPFGAARCPSCNELFLATLRQRSGWMASQARVYTILGYIAAVLFVAYIILWPLFE